MSKTLLHESLTILSPHQTRIQRSRILLKGAGPLSRGCVPMATWAERGGLRRRWRPCCPARSPRRRNTSTYPCCWRRPTSVPLTTPSIKVTDQILKLLAAHCAVTRRRVSEPRHILCLWPHCAAAAFFRLFFGTTIIYLLLLASVQKLPLKSLPILWCFYCLDCKLFSVAFVHSNIVWIVRFFFSYKFVLQFGTIRFIKGVDLIGTESKALWSLCLLHLSVCPRLSV